MHRFALWIPANIILVVILNPDPYYDDNKEEVDKVTRNSAYEQQLNEQSL